MRSGDLKHPTVVSEKFKTLSNVELHYFGKLMVKKPIMKDVVHLFMVATKGGRVQKYVELCIQRGSVPSPQEFIKRRIDDERKN
jgi:hypothetical protein